MSQNTISINLTINMKTIVAFIGLLAITHALPVQDGFVHLEEDTLGNYKLHYKTGESSRAEERTHDGRVVGSYSFVDPDGHEHTVTYLAAADHGFGASGADIPHAPAESHELLQARHNHLVELEKAHALGLRPDEPVPATYVLPHLTAPTIASLPAGFVPATDGDHYHATAHHLAAHQEALARLAQEYRRL